MIKHIVLWKMKDGAGRTARENAAYVKERLEGLIPVIDCIRSLEVHLDGSGNEANATAALLATFDSFDALRAYQVHPAHKKVSEYVASVTTARSCVDYEL